MKISIAIGVVLIVVGSAYIWWWNQPIKQMADLATQGHVPQNWEDLAQQYPHLCKTFRLLDIDPFDRTVEDPSQEAMRISQRVYLTAGRHALGGIVAILAGIMLPIVRVIRKRKRKKSEPTTGEYSTEAAETLS